MMVLAGIVATLVSAGLTFTPESLEGLGPGPSPSFNQRDHFTYIHAPLSKSGRPDLLTAAYVYFARDDHYGAADRAAYPTWEQAPLVDAWGDQLFARFPGRLSVYRFVAGAWSLVVDQAIAWPDDGLRGAPVATRAAASPLRFERYLYDVYGDSRPEIVLLGPKGLMVYVWAEGEYVLQGAWDIVPMPRLQPVSDVALWPQSARRFSLPGWEQAVRVLLEGPQLRVITREQDSRRETRYRQLRYALDGDGQSPKLVEDLVGAPLRGTLRPVRLNDEPTLQLAGVSWETARGRGIAPPRAIYGVSLDGGKHVQEFRAAAPPGWRARGPAVDWDGDGRLDLVVEHSHMYEGGVRESLARMLTRSAVDHSIAIHRQGAAGFETEARVMKRVTLALDRPPFRPCPQFEAYRNGERISLAGDFDGDGWRDLAVRSDRNTLDIYLTKENGFAPRPDHTMDLFADELFAIADLNENGKSDLIFYVPGQGSAASQRVRVFFSRGARP